jgi:hypothetical protein
MSSTEMILAGLAVLLLVSGCTSSRWSGPRESGRGRWSGAVTRAEARRDDLVDRETHAQFIDDLGADRIDLELAELGRGSRPARHIDYALRSGLPDGEWNCWLTSLQALGAWRDQVDPVSGPSMDPERSGGTPWTKRRELEAEEPADSWGWRALLDSALDGTGLDTLEIGDDADIYRELVTHGPLIYVTFRWHHALVIAGATFSSGRWYASVYDVASGERLAVPVSDLTSPELDPLFLGGRWELDPDDERVQQAFEARAGAR